MEMFSTSRSEKYFKDPMEMKPERWLRGNKDENEGNKDENLAFSNLQFGFGTRMCLGEKDQLVKARLFKQECFLAGGYWADS